MVKIKYLQMNQVSNPQEVDMPLNKLKLTLTKCKV